MKAAPPIRFLALAVGGWMAFRVAVLVPDWWPSSTGPAFAEPEETVIASTPEAPVTFVPGTRSSTFISPARLVARPKHSAGSRWERHVINGPGPRPTPGFPARGTEPGSPSPPAQAASAPVPVAFAAPSAPRAGRWSGSAWLLIRPEMDGSALAPASELGGSQAGARLLYRIGGGAARPLALSGRAYLPVDRPAGAEAAVGLDWRPLAGLPVHLLAERRFDIGGEGRSAFSLTLYGGVSSEPLPGEVAHSCLWTGGRRGRPLARPFCRRFDQSGRSDWPGRDRRRSVGRRPAGRVAPRHRTPCFAADRQPAGKSASQRGMAVPGCG